MNDAPTSHPVAMSPPRDPSTTFDAIITLLGRFENAHYEACWVDRSPHTNESRRTRVWKNCDARRLELVAALEVAFGVDQRDTSKSAPSASLTPARRASSPESLPESNSQNETP